MHPRTQSPESFRGFISGDRGSFGVWERAETNARLRRLSIEEAYEELASIFAVSSSCMSADVRPLLERDALERIDIVIRRQAAFRLLSEASSRGGRSAP